LFTEGDGGERGTGQSAGLPATRIEWNARKKGCRTRTADRVTPIGALKKAVNRRKPEGAIPLSELKDEQLGAREREESGSGKGKWGSKKSLQH